MLPNWKQPAKYEKALERFKKFIFSRKSFSSIEKKARIFLNEASKFENQPAQLTKRQQFKQIQKLKNEKNLSKTWKKR